MSKVKFTELYKDLNTATARLEATKNSFEEHFGVKPTRFFSAPGRTEVSGNHTDHNYGFVLAAAVDLDVLAAVVPTNEPIIKVLSQDFPEDIVDITYLSVNPADFGKSGALIKGVCNDFLQKGYKIGGFCAYTTSNVLKGSGLSSSAAFEVLIGTILNHLYNNGEISSVEIAKTAQYAENVYFGKPSGLMDQMASSVGGFISIDFENPAAPIINEMNFDISANGLSLCIVDTKGNHADLTPEYAAIPSEMKAVANTFGKSVLREVTKAQILEKLPEIRADLGDRAALRALHFMDENERVLQLCDYISNGDINGFLSVIKASGESSYQYLQNVYANIAPKVQGVSMALYLAKMLLSGEGACRVHGGGFAGTIQAFVPNSKLDAFKNGMEAVFGKGSCYILNVRPIGGTEVLI